MNGTAFQLNKVRRAIRTQGKLFRFTRPGKNKFNEPNGETESYEFVGVYHELTGYKRKSTGESATIREATMSNSAPMVLMLWEDAKELHHQDQVKFNDKTYRINEIKNLAEANLVADISLEEVQT